jgi:hypothetical protein
MRTLTGPIKCAGGRDLTSCCPRTAGQIKWGDFQAVFSLATSQRHSRPTKYGNEHIPETGTREMN